MLDLQHNEIPYLPNRIHDLYNLTTLLLDGNILLQPLPETFYSLCNLQHLSMRATALVCTYKHDVIILTDVIGYIPSKTMRDGPTKDSEFVTQLYLGTTW